MSTTTEVTPAPAPARRRHTLADFYHERTRFQFIERSWRWAILSGTIIVISAIAFAASGLNLGIDFEGGTQWQFTTKSGSASADAVRSALKPISGLGDAKVLIVGGNAVRVQSKDLPAAEQGKVTAALAKYGQIDANQVSLTNVGPTWGDKVSSKALKALVVFFLVIALYLTFRFEWRMAVAAIIAVIHDILITVGVYAITGFEVTPATVVAFLTILGFSLYDTVVVFDKVKDNQARLGTVRGDTYSSMVNRSMNQVLMRSINTSLVALLPVASLLFVGTYLFGGLTLRDFALALFVGLMTGAYSSIFVATPILAWLKEREPKFRALRARAESDLARAATGKPPLDQAPEAQPSNDAEPEWDDEALADETAAEAQRSSTGAPASGSYARPGSPTRGTQAPRPRQQRRRKRR